MSASAHDSKAPRILVVDDDAAIRGLIRLVLEASGCQVEEAESGAQTMQACSEGMPDIVFLDAVLPDADGFDLCRRLRGLPGGRGMPIVMATGLDVSLAQQAAKQAEATACISKPIDVPALQKIAERLVRQYG